MVEQNNPRAYICMYKYYGLSFLGSKKKCITKAIILNKNKHKEQLFLQYTVSAGTKTEKLNFLSNLSIIMVC